jgi:hypothetical protein
MALTILAGDSFLTYAEEGDLSRYYDAADGVKYTFATTGGVFNGPYLFGGAAGLNVNQDVTILSKNIPATQKLIAGVWAIGTYTGGAQSPFLCLRALGATQSQINLVYSNGVVHVYSQTTLLGSAACSLSSWGFLELYANIDQSPNGQISVFLNGDEILTLTGIDTQSHASINTASSIDIRPTGSTSAGDVFVGPWYCGSCTAKTDRLGPIKGVLLKPNADTADADFTLSTGVNGYALIDDVPDTDDTDYIHGNVSGDKSIFDLESIPAGTFGTIHFVKGFAIAKAENFTGHKLKVGVKSVASSTYSADALPKLVYENRIALAQTNPDGGGAWTESALNAAQISVELTT